MIKQLHRLTLWLMQRLPSEAMHLSIGYINHLNAHQAIEKSSG